MKRKLILTLAVPFFILGIGIGLSLALVAVGYLSRASILRKMESQGARDLVLKDYSKYRWE